MSLFSSLYIDGAWVSGSEGKTFPVINPADNSVITNFAIATESDALASVEAAEHALPSWSQTSSRERSEILRRAYDILTDEVEVFARTIVQENGKSWHDALGEATYAKEFFRWFAEEAVRVPGDFRISPSGDKRIVVTHQPVGVSLLITPWNFPAAMATRKLAPALAAGCTTILKPARETPLTAAYMVDVMERAGTPHGVVNLITPAPTGPIVNVMLRHPAVRKLSFTGSTEVGRELLHSAADTVVNTSMELGGNAPVVILPGADLDASVEGVFLAKMRNGGAACTAANRLYVHDDIHDAFVTRFKDRLKEVAMGEGSDPENDLGALVSTAERDKVATLVDIALREGATSRLGGSVPEGPGAFYPATLLTDIQHGSTINTTEIFGPVTAIVRVDDTEEAIRMANDTEYGLMAYVFGDEETAMSVARRLEVGMVAINRGVASDPAAPFGGVKQSGLGREGSSEGILEFLEEQYIALNS